MKRFYIFLIPPACSLIAMIGVYIYVSWHWIVRSYRDRDINWYWFRHSFREHFYPGGYGPSGVTYGLLAFILAAIFCVIIAYYAKLEKRDPESVPEAEGEDREDA